jgi:opacity protein-like surface antigen
MPSARHVLLYVAAAALMLASPPAAAHPYPPRYYAPAPPPPPAQRLSPVAGALRIGVTNPSGSITAGERLSDEFGTQLDLQGELGVRITPEFQLGGYIGAGIGEAGPRFDALCSFGDCGALTLRAGLLARYEFAPWSAVSPWLGYGFGFTWASASGDLDDGSRFESTFAGLDLARLQAGIDFRPGRGPVGLGLYVDYTLGVYRRFREVDPQFGVVRGSLDEPTVHHWFSIGPRISF